MHSRLQKRNRELQEQQQRLAAGAVEQRTVMYAATVRDAAGHEQAFRFEHQVDSSRLARVKSDKAEATRIIQEVTMPHYREMLQVRAAEHRVVPCVQAQHIQQLGSLHRPLSGPSITVIVKC
jgi:hypothetical protein